MECKAAVLSEQGEGPQNRDDRHRGSPRPARSRANPRCRGLPLRPVDLRRHPPFATPTVPGHEASGEVVEIGLGVSRVRPGDRVILSFIAACGACFHCVRGEPYLCAASDPSPSTEVHDGRRRRVSERGSAFAEYTRVPEQSCVPCGEWTM